MIPSLHRPTRAVIDLNAICQNIKTIQASIPQDKKIFAVVKANAYGHGAIKVAHAIHHLVAGFCVSNIDEALELRQAGISEPILILGVTAPDAVPLARDNQITLTVSSQEWLDLVIHRNISLDGLDVHLTVDSGMGRIGVRSLEEAEQLIAHLKKAQASVSGIFTHFATADEVDATKFNQQLEFFTYLVNHLQDKPSMVHASNSATTIWHNDTIFNAVRLGIAMYGLNPSGIELSLPYPIIPALCLESELVHVKLISKNSTVGYGATYKALKEEYIGTVPIGYADGWIRKLQGFSVLVNGQFCEIVGRISMDQMTIRLPEKFPIGTKVTLIGQNGGHAISATDLAQKCQTINYEMVCLLSDRVPRVYLK